MDIDQKHSLDTQLFAFDGFLDTHSHCHQSANFIYSYFGTGRKEEESARSEVSALKTCLISFYLRQIYKIRGESYSVFTSSHDSLFRTVETELGWTIPVETVSKIDDQILELLRNARRDGELESEAMEAARIASILFQRKSRPPNTDSGSNFIVVVSEDLLQKWEKVRSILREISATHTDDQRDSRITVVLIGRVTFSNNWAKSIVDYIKCRRNLIDLSYQQKIDSLVDDEIDENKRRLTFATIVFELLAIPVRRSTVIEPNAKRGGTDNDPEPILPQWARNGAFCLYNYARLCAILSKYDAGVRNGEYPELKPLDALENNVKDKVHGEMAELLKWLNRVSSIRDQLESKLPDIRNNIFNFSRQFSRYYSKRRVLTESITFTSSTADALMAKIHALFRLKKLYLFLFEMISVQPVESM